MTGFAGNDTDLKNVESMTEATGSWTNYAQTVFEAIEWTKHATLVRQGLSDANATALLIREAEIRVAEMLSKMSIRGVKSQATSAGGRYMSAGLLARLGSDERNALVYNVAGVLTETKFKAALKNRFDNGGTVNTIWCSPTTKAYVNAFLNADSSVALIDSKANHQAGGVYVDSYNYEGAILAVRVDADMTNDRIAVVNQSKCKKGWLSSDGLRLEDEPPVSSRETRKSLQGSVGFLVEDVGSDHLLLTGITGGSTGRVTSVSITNTTANPIPTQEVATTLERRGCRGKVWTTKHGVRHDGQIINSQMIYRMLKNPLYAGRVPHRNTSYSGEHEAIVSAEAWNRARELLKNNMTHDAGRRSPKLQPFAGLVTCGHCGGAITLSHTVKRGKHRYGYYICNEDRKRNFSICPTPRVPAADFEALVVKEPAAFQKTGGSSTKRSAWRKIESRWTFSVESISGFFC
ncbi:MAG: recombinase zinc beta ribbon domain-containing protein [Victivallales bacterium]|nr:recombinase zinc beta ribbon domain-containing protein [Victivallales bacterium]